MSANPMNASIHQYEDWLDREIDPDMYVRDGKLGLGFGPRTYIDISACDTIDGLFAAAAALRHYLESCGQTEWHPSIPGEYLLHRFCSLVAPYEKFRIDPSAMAKEITRNWGEYDGGTGRWG